MRKTKFQRLMALMLAFVFLLCGGLFGVNVSAADNDGVMTTEQIKAILNAISYEKYLAEHKDVPRATESIVLNATDGYEYVVGGVTYTADSALPEGADLAQVKKYAKDGGEISALYVPGNGTVSWTTDAIKTATKYSIAIEYYPVEGKPASIERTFQINGKVQFKVNIPAEADQAAVEAIVNADDRLATALAGRSIVKFIYVKGRIANIVAK